VAVSLAVGPAHIDGLPDKKHCGRSVIHTQHLRFTVLVLRDTDPFRIAGAEIGFYNKPANAATLIASPPS
jgi:hypothetical protein